MAVASVFAGRFVDAAHRQGMDAETAIAGPRVGLLRLLTKGCGSGCGPRLPGTQRSSPPPTADATFLEQKHRCSMG